MSVSTFVALLFVGLALLLALLAATYSGWYGDEVDLHADTKERLAGAEGDLDRARGRELELLDRVDIAENRARLLGDQLEDSQRRERLAINMLADRQGREHPFPDVDALAGSLGDEVEAWLATDPSPEQ